MISKFDITSDSYDGGTEIHKENDGIWVDSDDYDELRDLAIKLHEWCVGHGKLYTDKDKEIATKHDLF